MASRHLPNSQVPKMRPKPGMSLSHSSQTISFQKLRNQIKRCKFNYTYNYLHTCQGSFPKPSQIIQNNDMTNSQQSATYFCSTITGENVISIYKQQLIALVVYYMTNKDNNKYSYANSSFYNGVMSINIMQQIVYRLHYRKN
ncbi:Hypothetical_protein [Hexamita inflata]|uniref:Hypothetical_protein n=1 Tax=Hexamita inflata TaxID=28002 RepID=A0AA86PAX9_9EUKA|nr:Hypothetical protein HINF_LOCUS23022 [Hexamita inflata]